MRNIVVFFTLVFTCLTANADTKTEQAKNFAQSFYDWYGNQKNGYYDVVNHKPGLIEPSFLEELNTFANCQDGDDSCMIDADPFYVSQDPCDFYRATEAVYENGKYTVTMVGDCGQKISVPLIPNRQSFYIQSPSNID